MYVSILHGFLPEINAFVFVFQADALRVLVIVCLSAIGFFSTRAYR